MLHITKISQSGLRLPANVRKRLNNRIVDIIKPLQNEIPLSDIDDALRSEGCLLIQEDGTPWSGFLTGREGRTTIEVASINSKNNQNMYVPFVNTMLVLYWHKMDSGRYETIAYLS